MAVFLQKHRYEAHPPFRNHIRMVLETRRSPSALNRRSGASRKAREHMVLDREPVRLSVRLISL
jgi:hypothetical protein